MTSLGDGLDLAKGVCATLLYGHANPFAVCLLQRLRSQQTPVPPNLVQALQRVGAGVSPLW